MIKDNQKLLNLLHMIIDLAILVASYMAAYYLRYDDTVSFLIQKGYISFPSGYVQSPAYYARMLIFLIPCFIFIYSSCDLYNPKRAKGIRSEFFSLLKANIFGIVYTAAVLYFMKQTNYARLFMGIFFVLNFTLDYIFRVTVHKILKSMRRHGRNQKHVLLVGYSRTAVNYIDRLRAHPEWGYYVHGILDDNQDADFEYRNVKMAGQISQLGVLLETNAYDEIAITLSIDEYSKLESIVNVCEKSGVHTKFVPDYNNIIPTIPYTEDLDGIPVIHMRHVPLSASFNRFIKRAVDIFGSLFAIILFSIPMLITAIIIKTTSKGPLIFKQTRVGLHNREFEMYKFRSMVVQTEEAEREAWTVKNDPRVTKIGKFIRKTSIDELPQLFNVLKGDMSLIGPRPERPFFVEKYREEIPRYMIKHQVRPGMSGWAQVNGLRGDTSIEKRIEYDLYYVENWRLTLDFKILLMTFYTGFINKNAY